jgi:hypothetical protein
MIDDILFVLATGCFLTVHGPNNDAWRIDAASIFVIRPNSGAIKSHVHEQINTILYVDGQKFGIVETPEQIESMIRQCDKEQQNESRKK